MKLFLCLFLWFWSLFQGVPDAAKVTYLSICGENVCIYELRWTKPKDNGSPITSYTIYKRLIDKSKKNEWVKEKTLKMDAPRSYNITLEGGKDYEIVITATNTLGEAKKEESKIVVIEVPKGKTLLFYSDVKFWQKKKNKKERKKERKKEDT